MFRSTLSLFALVLLLQSATLADNNGDAIRQTDDPEVSSDLFAHVLSGNADRVVGLSDTAPPFDLSRIAEGVSRLGIIDVDPAVISTARGDDRRSPGSPGVGQCGDDPEFDLYGAAHIALIHIGAFEVVAPLGGPLFTDLIEST